LLERALPIGILAVAIVSVPVMIFSASGLDRLTAMTLAAQTVLGSAKLLIETGAHPGQLKDMVTSPGGTAIAGIAALEEGGVRRTLISAVERATLRSRELGRGTRDSRKDTPKGKKKA